MEDQVTLLDFIVGRCQGFRVTRRDNEASQWRPSKVKEEELERYVYISTHVGRVLKWLTVRYEYNRPLFTDYRSMYYHLSNSITKKGVKEPNFIVANHHTCTAELWYALKEPVHVNRVDEGITPSSYCKAVFTTIKKRLGSRTKSLLMCSMSPWWSEYEVYTYHDQPMMLDEIRPSGDLEPNSEMYLDLGDYLFQMGRYWAYNRVKDEMDGIFEECDFEADLLHFLASTNMDGFIYDEPPPEECKRIGAKIVEFVNTKYRSMRSEFVKKQSERGKLKGQVFRDEKQPLVYQLLDEGKTPKEIERLTKVKRDTVRKWQNDRKNATRQPRGLQTG